MPDVNVLVYAHRQDERWHEGYREWLERSMAGPQPLALSVLVAAGFIRVVTNPRIFPDPTPTAVALAAIDNIASHPGCRVVTPGPDHLAEVSRLCRAVAAAGKHVSDAQNAAVAIAEGATWVTRDDDFARFAQHGLSWQHLSLG